MYRALSYLLEERTNGRSIDDEDAKLGRINHHKMISSTTVSCASVNRLNTTCQKFSSRA